MKVLVVLVLAVFSGCQASLLFHADEPKLQLDVLTDAFWDYVAKATKTADDTVQIIRSSQLGQDVSARLTESADMAGKYAVSVQEQLPPVAQELITKVTTEADMLKERLAQELGRVRDKLQPLIEDLRAKMQQRVEQLKQEVASYADAGDYEAMRTILMKKNEELRTSLEQGVRDLQAQLWDFKEGVMPMTERVQGELSQRAQQVQQMAAPYVSEMKGRLDSYAQELQARLTSLYEYYVQAS